MTVHSRACLPGALVALVLLVAPGGLAWHSPDEALNVRYGAMAGDPRVKEDAAECLESVREIDGVVCVALYAHLKDTPWRFGSPLTTQRPAACAPETYYGPRVLLGGEQLFYAGGSAVEYHLWSGTECTGISNPTSGELLTLEAGVPIQGFWYVAASTQSNDPIGLGAMPCLTLEMSLEAGNLYSDHSKRQTLATARTTKTVVFAEALGGTPGPNLDVPCPGAAGEVFIGEVVEFLLDFGVLEEPFVVDRYDQLVVRVRAFHHESADEDPRLMPLSWDQKGGESYPNRIVLPFRPTIALWDIGIRNLSDAGSAPYEWRVADPDGRVLRLEMSSALSRDDIDVANIRFYLEGAEGVRSPVNLGPGTIEDIDDSGTELWLWYRWDKSLPTTGNALIVSVPNWQHTSVAEARMELDGPAAVEEQVPSLGAAVLALALFGCLVLLGRRGA